MNQPEIGRTMSLGLQYAQSEWVGPRCSDAGLAGSVIERVAGGLRDPVEPMPRYPITNAVTGEQYEVEAHFAEDACKRLRWDPECCTFVVLRDEWVTHFEEAPLKVGSA